MKKSGNSIQTANITQSTHRRGGHRLPTHRRGGHRLPTHRRGAHRLPTNSKTDIDETRVISLDGQTRVRNPHMHGNMSAHKKFH